MIARWPYLLFAELDSGKSLSIAGEYGDKRLDERFVLTLDNGQLIYEGDLPLKDRSKDEFVDHINQIAASVLREKAGYEESQKKVSTAQKSWLND